LGGLTEGQRCPGRLDTLQGRSIQGAGAGHCDGPKDQTAGNKTGLAEQRALTGTQGKKGEFMSFERRGRPLRRTTRMSRGYAGRPRT